MSGDEAWNFGPEKENIVSVKELIDKTIVAYGQGEWEDISNKEKQYEAKLLSLDITKAKTKLNWQPVFTLDETVKYTVDWYKKYKTENVFDLCNKQIEEYSNKWKLKKEK